MSRNFYSKNETFLLTSDCDKNEDENSKIGSKCATKDAIYLVICDLCAKSYLGETERSTFMEHRRAANNHSSDPESAIGQHYLTEHLGEHAM